MLTGQNLRRLLTCTGPGLKGWGSKDPTTPGPKTLRAVCFTAAVIDTTERAICTNASYKPKIMPMSFISSLCTLKVLFLADNVSYFKQFSDLFDPQSSKISFAKLDFRYHVCT